MDLQLMSGMDPLPRALSMQLSSWPSVDMTRTVVLRQWLRRPCCRRRTGGVDGLFGAVFTDVGKARRGRGRVVAN
jgi:hypothetical protein